MSFFVCVGSTDVWDDRGLKLWKVVVPAGRGVVEAASRAVVVEAATREVSYGERYRCAEVAKVVEAAKIAEVMPLRR